MVNLILKVVNLFSSKRLKTIHVNQNVVADILSRNLCIEVHREAISNTISQTNHTINTSRENEKVHTTIPCKNRDDGTHTVKANTISQKHYTINISRENENVTSASARENGSEETHTHAFACENRPCI